MNQDSTLKNINAIAYDKTLREYLNQLHTILDQGITDMSAQAVRLSIKYKDDAVNQLKFMSKLTADLSVALIKARGDKELDPTEKEQFDTIKQLADSLGNLQFKTNRLIMDISNMEKLGSQISHEGEVLLDTVMEVEGTMTRTRAAINDLGYFSQNPQISRLFDKQNE